MRFKILFVVPFVMLLSVGAKAQVYIQGGLNLANITTTDAGETQESHLLATFNAGIFSRFNISKVFDLESGIVVEGRGAKSDTYFTSSRDDNYVKARFNPIYLKIPAHAVIKIPLAGNNEYLFVYAGPYGAMGIGGRSKLKIKLFGSESTSTSDIRFNGDDPTTSEQEGARYDRIRRFDFGIDAGAGIDFGNLMLKVNYGIGFTKINAASDNSDGGDKNKYRTGGLMLTIPFGR